MKESRRAQLSPLLLMEYFSAAQAKQRGGADVLHLTLGQPGLGAPEAAIERAMMRVRQGGAQGYTDAAGIPELRVRIARHYKERYGLSIPASRILVTIGASSAFLLSMLSAFDAGEQVAITTPYYPAYPNIMRAMGLEPVLLRGEAHTHFQPTAAMVEALPVKPQGLVIASPSNPTGTVIPKDELQKLVACCERYRIRLISDEIYHGITYGEDAATALGFTDDAIIINSFSKYWRMPGWRLGWVVLPESLCGAFERLAESFFLSPPALSQYVALEAMDCEEDLEAVVAGYHRNRDILLNALPKMGIHRIAPAEGAFYIYADVSEFTQDSGEFCKQMLEHCGVAAIPGYDFDPERGKAFVRFSFAGKEEDVRAAVERLGEWMGKGIRH